MTAAVSKSAPPGAGAPRARRGRLAGGACDCGRGPSAVRVERRARRYRTRYDDVVDWSNVRGDAPRGAERLPPLRLLETCWRLRSPRGRVITCGIYQTTAPGLEVRAGYGVDDLLRSQRTPGIGAARELADEWRETALAKSGFNELHDPGR